MYTVLTTESFDAWFERIRDRLARVRILARIKRLEQGLHGDCKHLGGHLQELRIDHGPGYRLYFVRQNEEFIVLLCGGDKGSQQRDIDKARELAAVLLERALRRHR